MKGGTRAASSVASLVLALGVAAPGSAQNLLYVASQDEVTVAVIDMGSNRLVETVDLKELGFASTAKAHHTAVEPDGSFWYVSLISAGKVLKFDRDNELVGQVDFETPGMLGLDPGSDRLYVGRSMAAVNPPQRVGVIDRQTMTIEEVDVFVPRPHAIAVDPRGQRFFSASLAQNSVAYAPLGDEEVDLLNLGGDMQMLVQFAVSPDGRWMVAGGQMTGDLLVFDISGGEPTLAKTVSVGGQPWHPSFTQDGATLWIPNQAASTVTVLDTEDWSIIDVIAHEAIAEPHGSAISPDGRTIYVSSHNLDDAYTAADGSHPGTVVAIDTSTHEIVSVIEMGRYAAGMSAPAPIPAGAR